MRRLWRRLKRVWLMVFGDVRHEEQRKARHAKEDDGQ
jgi:hypothetical protein